MKPRPQPDERDDDEDRAEPDVHRRVEGGRELEHRGNATATPGRGARGDLPEGLPSFAFRRVEVARTPTHRLDTSDALNAREAFAAVVEPVVGVNHLLRRRQVVVRESLALHVIIDRSSAATTPMPGA